MTWSRTKKIILWVLRSTLGRKGEECCQNAFAWNLRVENADAFMQIKTFQMIVISIIIIKSFHDLIPFDGVPTSLLMFWSVWVTWERTDEIEDSWTLGEGRVCVLLVDKLLRVADKKSHSMRLIMNLFENNFSSDDLPLFSGDVVKKLTRLTTELH